MDLKIFESHGLRVLSPGCSVLGRWQKLQKVRPSDRRQVSLEKVLDPGPSFGSFYPSQHMWTPLTCMSSWPCCSSDLHGLLTLLASHAVHTMQQADGQYTLNLWSCEPPIPVFLLSGFLTQTFNLRPFGDCLAYSTF